MTSKPTLEELADRVVGRLGGAAPGARFLLGITGSPGAGKTTLAELLITAIGQRLGPEQVAHVPMDGYHLADVALDRLGLRDRKGAPATFDPYGYTALLRRLRENADPVVYAPGFDRTLEQPVAGAIAVPHSARVIVSEGNYLLLDGDWAGVHGFFDEVWFARPPEDLRLERLLARHVEFGKTREEAIAWIAATDEPNAVSVAATAGRADLVVLVE